MLEGCSDVCPTITGCWFTSKSSGTMKWPQSCRESENKPYFFPSVDTRTEKNVATPTHTPSHASQANMVDIPSRELWINPVRLHIQTTFEVVWYCGLLVTSTVYWVSPDPSSLWRVAAPDYIWKWIQLMCIKCAFDAHQGAHVKAP